MKDESKEPEQLTGDALYLLQLIQQDLNLGRKDTIWARAKDARIACQQLEAMYHPTNPKNYSEHATP